MEQIKNIAARASLASKKIASVKTETKNTLLENFAINIDKNRELIIEANEKDLISAQEKLSNGKITNSMFQRLKIDDKKIDTIISSIRDVIKLEDPINKTLWAIELDSDLTLNRTTTPIGVIGVIFESRPDVIPQIVSLAVKSSNSVILKGGSEALHTNSVFEKLINNVLDNNELYPDGTVTLIESRADVNKMLELDEYIDLIIPRGSNKLVKFIQSNTNIPVMGHSDGICSIYIDEKIDSQKALAVVVDSKCAYPSACNAVETILVHKKQALGFLPELISTLKNNNVTVLGCKETKNIVSDIDEATEKDWQTEYSDLKVSIKTVNNLDEAIEHINTYGSGHTDTIITEDKNNADYFMNNVDSAGVYLNASTRFADGFRYGLGAEVGISTNKLHARGPVGLEGLTSYKYKLVGNGHISSDYNNSKKSFTHKLIDIE